MPARIPQNILIVDDSPTDRLYLKKLLDSADRRLSFAETGQVALDILDRQDFALVLLDVDLTDMDGYRVATEMRATDMGKHVPIIFITASSTQDAQVFRGYDSGAVDYLFKPVQPSLLRSKVSVFCELHAQRQTIETQLSEIRAKNGALKQQLDEIKVLRGFIPICASCKKVRDDSGYWGAIETYIKAHSDAEFSHAICPECAATLYPGVNLEDKST